MSKEHKEQCQCGCHEEELNEDVVVLEDEDGNEISYHYITTLEHEGKEYVYLQPADGEDADTLEVYELQSVTEGDQEYDNLLPVDESLYSVLYEKLMKAIEEDDCNCDCGDDDDCCCDHEHGECHCDQHK